MQSSLTQEKRQPERFAEASEHLLALNVSLFLGADNTENVFRLH
jgi:hypothetical protein